MVSLFDIGLTVLQIFVVLVRCWHQCSYHRLTYNSIYHRLDSLEEDQRIVTVSGNNYRNDICNERTSERGNMLLRAKEDRRTLTDRNIIVVTCVHVCYDWSYFWFHKINRNRVFTSYMKTFIILATN